METIILKDNEVLKDQVYGNEEFDCLIKVVGDDVLIENLLIYSPKKDFHRIIQVSGKRCIIKNCRIQDISVKGCCIVVEHQEEPDYCIIQDCLFMNGKDMNSNGNEAIRVGESKTSLKGLGKNIIINNRFEDWNREIEIISVKNCENIIVNNEVINCAGTITLRHGTDNLIAYNFIDGKMKKDSGGIRVCDSRHIIINNMIQNIQGDGLRTGISLMCGVKNSPLNRYRKIEGCLIKNNTFFNCNNALSLGMKKKEASIKPKNVVLEMNIFDRCKNQHSLHKNNIGAELKDYLNIGDREGKKKLKYDTIRHLFNLKSFDELKNDIIEYKEEIEEEEENEEPIKEENINDDLLNQLTKRLKLVMYENRIRKIQESMEKNLIEFRKLMKELKELN